LSDGIRRAEQRRPRRIDDRVHYVDIAETPEVEDLRRGSIVAVGPEPTGDRA
jgi:hypothetical protein